MQSDFLGLILIAQGSISRDDLFAGLRRQSQTGEMLGEALVKLGAMSESDLERALAVQIGAPRFEAEWIAEEPPEPPCEVPEGVDVRFIYGSEGLEIWGVRTPAGRAWLEKRAVVFQGKIGVYVLPDRAWRKPESEPEATEGPPESSAAQALSCHDAIERLYDAANLEDALGVLGRGLHDMFSHVSVAAIVDGQPQITWVVGTEVPVDRFELCDAVEGWQVNEAGESLRESVAQHGWRLVFSAESGLVAVIYAFDDDIDDPIVFQELTREFESSHKLLMERVNSG